MSSKEVQNELKDSVNKIWLAGLGALSTAEQEGQKWFKTLVEKGEEYQKRGQERVEDVKERFEDAADKAKERAGGTFGKFEEKIDELVSNTLRRTGVPGREEIAALTKRVEELTALVEQLQPAAKPARKTTARKSTAKAKTAEAKPATAKA